MSKKQNKNNENIELIFRCCSEQKQNCDNVTHQII